MLNEYSKKELFNLLTEEDVHEIIKKCYPEPKDTTHWRTVQRDVPGTETGKIWSVCVKDKPEAANQLQSWEFEEMILTNNLDIYRQGHEFRNKKHLVTNLFDAYLMMYRILEEKLTFTPSA